MSHAFKFCVIAISAVLIGDRALAQCFVCSDSSSNTAIGTSALSSGTNNGPNNTAVGYKALYSNTAGKGNDAQGVNALYSNTTGIRNLAIGSNALYANTTGSYSVALGFDAGYDQTTGNDDIYINNVGMGGESQTLRLGTAGTPGVIGSGILTAYIAGVATSQVTGGAVYVTSSGQLGVLASSERFKMEVETMQEASDKLAQLRPVTFKLKTDPKGTVQYGLIAEEVAKVYPELVIHGAGGSIDGVRYEELAPMLLYEVQQQRQQLRDMQRQMVAMRATLVKLRAQDQLVALR
jgi:trimeric autotransporter adhesin